MERRAIILTDVPAKKTHDLVELLREQKRSALEIGKAPENDIQVGEDMDKFESRSAHLYAVSRGHATLLYNHRTDKCFLTDHSKFGTAVLREEHGMGRPYFLDDHEPFELIEGDEVYLGGRINEMRARIEADDTTFAPLRDISYGPLKFGVTKIPVSKSIYPVDEEESV